ncbi:DUF3310 domain-containing protein [Alkanindiges illinoisensis]|uniref:DUF3310 domain-containing protein n=1 Tax=Alkanindiges illinoisensis TaxID=197183 RepID=UPI000A51C36B|nr:DUF3310 domain-containing protein [Alkanindiges illinoisensis]
MKLQNLTLQQLKEIVDGAPEGATHVVDYDGIEKYDYLKDPDTWVAWYGSHWNKPGLLIDLSDKTIIKLSNIRTRIAELEPKQKYDWSNVPDVVNWLATDKDGDCAWGFLEEPVIELEDGEWRPVAPYTEIYINGSNGTVAAYKGDWQESLEQRKFKIGDKVTFIRNIEPFQWGAKEKVYEVVDVADNLPTSTDQRVWLDTTASSPHLSRNLCLATAIGQLGIEDLPVHGEPISSEIITNEPVIDGPQTQLDNEAALFNEPLTECELIADPVNHPSHYTSDPSGIECIQITRHRNFNIGNAIKYLWHAGLKDQSATVQDLQKAIWYINDEIERLKGEQGE